MLQPPEPVEFLSADDKQHALASMRTFWGDSGAGPLEFWFQDMKCDSNSARCIVRMQWAHWTAERMRKPSYCIIDTVSTPADVLNGGILTEPVLEQMVCCLDDLADTEGGEVL
jgi:hypothetical protein